MRADDDDNRDDNSHSPNPASAAKGESLSDREYRILNREHAKLQREVHDRYKKGTKNAMKFHNFIKSNLGCEMIRNARLAAAQADRKITPVSEAEEYVRERSPPAPDKPSGVDRRDWPAAARTIK